MKRNTLCVLGMAWSILSSAGCGGRNQDAIVGGEEGSTLSALEAQATVQRAYVGVTNEVTTGAVPVVADFDLRGGAQVQALVATRDGSPVRFELWRVRGDGTASLVSPVDSRSGFALQRIDADQDGTWLLRFPAAAAASVVVRLDCAGGIHGCTPERQPGQSCPAGWSCDQGLTCELPIGACSPLAAAGVCVVVPTACPEDVEPMCGCDGHTYASECAALVAGVPILHGGACP